MVVGVGLDLVSINRMKQLAQGYGARFLERCFVPGEVPRDLGDFANLLVMARAWCLKEAFLKALGGSISGLPYREVTIAREVGGQLGVKPVGQAYRALVDSGANRIEAFASTTASSVAGIVILLAEGERPCKGLGGSGVV